MSQDYFSAPRVRRYSTTYAELAAAGFESHTATTDILLTAVSTVGLPNAATAGAVDVWVLWGVAKY